jgi:hypothetical protein
MLEMISVYYKTTSLQVRMAGCLLYPRKDHRNAHNSEQSYGKSDIASSQAFAILPPLFQINRRNLRSFGIFLLILSFDATAPWSQQRRKDERNQEWDVIRGCFLLLLFCCSLHVHVSTFQDGLLIRIVLAMTYLFSWTKSVPNEHIFHTHTLNFQEYVNQRIHRRLVWI